MPFKALEPPPGGKFRPVNDAPDPGDVLMSTNPFQAVPEGIGMLFGASPGQTRRSLGQGVSLGFSDELQGGIAAGVTAVKKAITGRGSPAQAYRDTVQHERDAQAAFHAAHPVLDTADQIAGSLATPGVGEGAGLISGARTLGGAAVRSGLIGAAYGGVSGAGYGEGGLISRARSAGVGAAVGGAIGALAAPVAAAATSIAAPAVGAAKRQLLDAGVRLTPGQIAGGVVKRAEDAATSIPGLGSAIVAARRRASLDFNRAAANRALGHLGETLPEDVRAGHELVQHIQDRVGKAYTDALDKMSVTADPAFSDSLNARIAEDVATLPEAQKKQLGSILESKLFGKLTPGAQGDTVKTIDSELGRLTRQYSSSTDADQRTLGHILGDVQDHYRTLLSHQNPELAPKLAAANAAYADLVRIERAAAKSADGTFTPSMFQSAVRQSDTTMRKRATASGNARLQDLAKAASEVLPSSIPDSGTAGRLLHGNIAGLITGLASSPLGLIYTDPAVRAAGAMARPSAARAAAVRGAVRRALPITRRGAVSAVVPQIYQPNR